MAKIIKINEKTPCGGAYSEAHFFDENGNPVDETKATRCAIRECAENGELLNETWATVEKR